MNLLEFGASLAANAVLTNCEEPPLRRIRLSQPSNGAVVTRALRNARPDSLTKFAKSKSRSAILLAAKNYLSSKTDHEELVVFFGKRRGDGAVFEGFWLNRGDRSGVGFTRLALSTIQGVVMNDRSEIVIVHNHPPNDLKALLASWFGWRPLPSSADRETALAHNVPTWVWLLSDGFGPRLKWYLVDEGEIAEFYLPSVERCLELARAFAGFVSTPARSE